MSLPLIEVLLLHGADPHTTPSPLHFAAQHALSDYIPVLLQRTRSTWVSGRYSVDLVEGKTARQVAAESVRTLFPEPNCPKLTFLYKEEFVNHHTPANHVEQPARVLSFYKAFERLAGELGPAVRLSSQFDEATRAQLGRAHALDYVDELSARHPEQTINITQIMDTWMSPQSLHVALLAAGAVCHAVDLISTGATTTAFCNIRP